MLSHILKVIIVKFSFSFILSYHLFLSLENDVKKGEEKVEKQIDMKKSSSVEDEEYKEMKDLNKKLESLASYVSNTQNRLKQLKSTATKKKQTKVDNLKKNLNDYNKSKNKIENRIEQIVQEIDDFVCFKKKYEKFKYVMKHVNKLTNIKEEKVENKHVDEEVEEEEEVDSDEDSDHHLDNDNESSSRFVEESSEIEFVTCETSLENQEIESNKLYFKTEFEEKIQTILKNCPYLIYNPDGYFDFREDVEYEQNYGKRPVSFRQAFPSFFN
jgi:transcriptional regulator with PAS, ATPase and Fis domain